jgi:predicted component of type VI protein secretion system
MQVSLVIVEGKPLGARIPLIGSVFLIGRHARCQLRPRDESVSNFHCAILQRGQTVSVRDLQSSNGSFVNAQRLTEEVRVTHGDLLRVAALRFAFHIDVQAPTPLFADARADPDIEKYLQSLVAPEPSEKGNMMSFDEASIFDDPTADSGDTMLTKWPLAEPPPEQ